MNYNEIFYDTLRLTEHYKRKMSAQLNFKQEGEGSCILLIHGLFGTLDNLGLLARDLRQDHQIISVDLRNHGLSPQSDVHDYPSMAQDIAELITALDIDSLTVIGHSMGGKVAMQLASIIGARIEKLVVMDMAPVAYTEARHDAVFRALFAVIKAEPTSRAQAMEILNQGLTEPGVAQFLGKSLYNDQGVMRWRFNVPSLKANYWHILGWQPLSPISAPTLFLKGANSPYIQSSHQGEIIAQFPNAKAHIIANTGHWLHAEKPAEVIRAIRKFIGD